MARKRKTGGRKRGNKKSYRMKRRHKNKKKGTSVMSVPRGKGLTYFTDRFRCKLKYQFNENMNPGGTLSAVRVFRGNGAYDPLYAVGGSSPAGWQQMTNLYQYYRCFGSSIRITPQPGAGASAIQLQTLYGVCPMTGITAEQGIHYQNNPRSKYKYTSPLYSNSSVRHMAKTTTVLGTPNGTGYLSEYSSHIVSVPAAQWYWHVWATNPDQSDQLLCRMYTEITYYLEFYMPRSDLSYYDENNTNSEIGVTGSNSTVFLEGITGGTGAYVIPAQ